MLLSATIEYYLRPQIGLFLVNCPLHGAVSHAYSNMAVPVVDGGGARTVLLRDILTNFIRETHPFQAIDDMSVLNENCTTKIIDENKYL